MEEKVCGEQEGRGSIAQHQPPCSGGNAATLLLLCLPKGGRGRAGREAELVLESLPLIAFPVFICVKVIYSLGLQTHPAHLPPAKFMHKV